LRITAKNCFHFYPFVCVVYLLFIALAILILNLSNLLIVTPCAKNLLAMLTIQNNGILCRVYPNVMFHF